MNHLGEPDKNIPRWSRAVMTEYTQDRAHSKEGLAERGKREQGKGRSSPEALQPKVCSGGISTGSFASLEGRVCLGAWMDTRACKGLCLLSIPMLGSGRQFLVNTVELSRQLSG